MVKQLFTEGWHLSKSVTLSIILGLAAQAILFTWAASALTAELKSGINTNAQSYARLNTELSETQNEITEMKRAAQTQAIQMARIEENTRNLVDGVSAIQRTLERYQLQGQSQ